MTRTGSLTRDGAALALHGGGTKGPMLVMQHGLCGSAGQVAEVMAGLPDQIWRCLDCPGHGASPLVGPVSIAAFAGHVAALLDSLPGPVVLGGISMGAAIATHLAVHRPDRVRGLILVRPAWATDPAPANMAPNAEVGALLSRLPPVEALRAFVAGGTAKHLSDSAPDNLASLLGFFDRIPQDETARLLTQISADGPGISRADLAALRLPVLVCGTGQDAIHPLALARDLAGSIPGARFAELPPKAEDKPAHLAALAAAMTAFLQEF